MDSVRFIFVSNQCADDGGDLIFRGMQDAAECLRLYGQIHHSDGGCGIGFLCDPDDPLGLYGGIVGQTVYAHPHERGGRKG